MIQLRRELCTYLGGCVSLCPSDALDLAETNLVVDEGRCNECGLYSSACPVGALLIEGEYSLAHARQKYDVVVVEAGPAGSIAARLAAERGLAVLLLEKRHEIGSPVRCAEAIDQSMLLPFLEPDDRWISARISKDQIVIAHTGGA